MDNSCDWHTCPLRSLLAEHEKLDDTRFAANDQIRTILEGNSLHWREQANGWREMVTKREADFFPRTMGLLTVLLAFAALALAVWAAMHK